MPPRRRSLSSARANESSRRRTAAFTLIELMAVLVIIGIAAAIVVPMLGNTGDIRTAAAARKLTSDLLYAQNYAITHQTRVRVTFDAAASTYTLAEVPAVGQPAVLTHPITRRPFVVAFGSGGGLSGVQLSNVDFSAPAVEFDSLGAPNEGGTITLTSGTISRILTVAPVTGKISVD